MKILNLDHPTLVEHYPDMVKLAVILNHDVVDDGYSVIRWKSNALARHLFHSRECGFRENRGMKTLKYYGTPLEIEDDGPTLRGRIDLNQLRVDFDRNLFTLEEYMKFNMGLGYSLAGFTEIFGQCEASEWKLPGALPASRDKESYAETPIDYVIRVHAGSVLKI